MHRMESVPAPTPRPAPFKHPHYETPRDRQFRALKRECRAFIAAADAMRARLARVRVLESVQ